MTIKATSLAAILLLILISGLCQAQDFSADVVYGSASSAEGSATGSSHSPSKIYVSKDKIRLETNGPTGTILLVNRGEHSALALFPGRKMYQPLSAGPSQYFRASNVEDACPEWQKAVDQKIECEKVGQEVVNERTVVKYRNKVAANDATTAVWIDSALKFVIKWESALTGAELRNIKEEPQAASLFTTPSDYNPLKPLKTSSKGFGQRSR